MLTASQIPVGSASAVFLAEVPGGYQVGLTVTSGTAYVGNSTAVTVTSGAPFSGGYALLPGLPQTSAPSTLYAITNGGTIPVGVILAGPR